MAASVPAGYVEGTRYPRMPDADRRATARLRPARWGELLPRRQTGRLVRDQGGGGGEPPHRGKEAGRQPAPADRPDHRRKKGRADRVRGRPEQAVAPADQAEPGREVGDGGT